MFGKVHSASALAKLTKLVYVYNSSDMSFLREYPTVKCYTHFSIGKDTLTKYINSGLSYKGKIFSRSKLH